MTVEQAWWQHLQTARWFGGKGREGAITELERLPAYTPAGAVPQVGSEIATISYADGRREFYHLLVARYPLGTAPVPTVAAMDSDIVDATTDPAAVRAFVEALQASPGQAMEWRVPLSDVRELPLKVWAGEQSNTTLVVGGDALFKLFRKIEPGPNLDAEVLDALADTPAATPALFGRLRGAWPGGDDATDLGMLIERVPQAQDGWELAGRACAAGADFAEEARALGRELRSVHEQLRIVFGRQPLAGAETADLMTARLQDAAGAAAVLTPYVPALTARFDALRGAKLDGQRVHGDFHLGQTLRSPSGWTIIDFEGEPAKSADERRAFDSVWRDVAGMLRSFDYARSQHAEPDGAQARAWAKACRDAFCAGYGATDALGFGLLGAYETDKAVYEVLYETRNRPDWVSIPLGAIESLAAADDSPTNDQQHCK